MKQQQEIKLLIVIWIVVALILLSFLFLVPREKKQTEKMDFETLKQKYNLLQNAYVIRNLEQRNSLVDIVVESSQEHSQEEVEYKRPYIKDVPLSDELLDYTYQLSIDYDIPYTLILAIINVESNFDKDVVSKTNDYGLAQINQRYISWMANEAGIENVDPLNPEHNVLMAVWYLDYLRNYWSTYNVSEEDKFYLVVLSYNKGIEGAKDWIKSKGWSNNYVAKVLETKIYYEENMEV